MLFNYKKSYNKDILSDSGYTFLEILTVFLILGILSAIAAPSWLAFLNHRRLIVAQNEVYQAIIQAQNMAKKEKISFSASFQEQNNRLQWSVHPVTVDPVNATWYSLDANIQLDTETTIPLSQGIRKIEFDYLGTVKPPLRRITLSIKSEGKSKRCIFISTILGTLRKAKENNKPDNTGRYCY